MSWKVTLYFFIPILLLPLDQHRDSDGGFQAGGEKLLAGDSSSNLASRSSKSFPILRISALAIRLPSSLADSRVKIQQPAAAWNDGVMSIVSFIF